MPQRSKRTSRRSAAHSIACVCARCISGDAIAAMRARSAKASRSAVYFAYGSNLDPAQMRERCPSARAEARAVLHGYAIAFGGWSERWGGAVASIVPVRGSRVEGMLYRIDPADLARLDRFEGCPFAYERFKKIVTDERSKKRSAHVYLQTSSFFDEPRMPSKRYFKQIVRAYGRLGFRFEALAAAVGVEL